MDKKTLTLVCMMELGLVFGMHMIGVCFSRFMDFAVVLALRYYGLWFVIVPLCTVIFGGQRIMKDKEEQVPLVVVIVGVLGLIIFVTIAATQHLPVGTLIKFD